MLGLHMAPAILDMDLSTCNFGGATSRGLGHMHPKLVTAKFIKWFYSHMRRAAMDEWFKTPAPET